MARRTRACDKVFSNDDNVYEATLKMQSRSICEADRHALIQWSDMIIEKEDCIQDPIFNAEIF